MSNGIPEQCSSCGGGCGRGFCKTKNVIKNSGSSRPENPPNIYKNGRLKSRKEMDKDKTNADA